MTSTIRFLTLAGCALLFLLSYNMLEMIGWRSLSGATSITKIHPSFYIFLPTALLALATDPARYLQTVRKPSYFLYLIAAILVVIRGATIVSDGTGGGELSAAIVTWLIPALMLVGIASFDTEVTAKVGVAIRIFFVANSLMGLLERVLSTHFIPSLIVGVNDPRAAAMLGHPLNASMMTGIMIVHLASARRGTLPIYTRIPELLLHGLAMFAFGGRSALVATVAVIIFSSLVARQKRNEHNLSGLQRALPYIVLLVGVILILAPLPFVDATLDRFSNDGKSSETRNSAMAMLGFLSPHDLLLGVDISRRTIIQTFFHSPYGIELAWVALTMIYGLIIVVPLACSLFLLLYRTAANLDRSAFYMAIAFTIITAGSLSIGSKSLLISQTLLMMIALGQRRYIALPGDGRIAGAVRSGSRKGDMNPASRPSPASPAADDTDDVPSFLR